jgi:hypothetical protein
LSVSYGEDGVTGTYRGLGPEPISLQVTVPERWAGHRFQVVDSGGARELAVQAGEPVELLLMASSGMEVAFQIERNRSGRAL